MRAGSDYPVRRGVRDAARLRPDDVQARDGVHDDEDAAGVQLPLLPLPALRSPVWRHALSTPPTPARRCVMWIHGSFVLWGRTACDLCCSYVCLGARWDGDTRARARDTDEASTRVHTAHRSTRSARRETRGASHAASCERTPACREGSRGRQPADDGQPAGR